MKVLKVIALASAAMVLPSTANAVTVVQHTGTSLGSFSYTVNNATNTITLNEVWNNTNNVFLRFTDLDLNINWTIIKNITNNTGTTWTSIANELLDNGGDANDASDVRPYPSFVPTGYTTSNDDDGLSFAQGFGTVRSSTAFPTVVADENSDARDFLDFIGGTVANGQTFQVRYSIRNTTSTNDPFLLSQRVNVRSVGPAVPEPATWGLMIAGFGLVGGTMRVRARTRRTALAA